MVKITPDSPRRKSPIRRERGGPGKPPRGQPRGLPRLWSRRLWPRPWRRR